MLNALLCPQCGAPLSSGKRCDYCRVRFEQEDMAGKIARWNGIGDIDDSGNVTPWYKVDLGIESTTGTINLGWESRPIKFLMTDEMADDIIVGGYFVDNPEALCVMIRNVSTGGR